MSAEYGLLIDYEFCTGCHSCEMACKVRQDMNEEQYGIKISQIGPFNIEGDRFMYRYYPIPTDMCDGCADLVAKGKRPTCVHHCQSQVMIYGKLEDLYEELKRKPLQVVYALS